MLGNNVIVKILEHKVVVAVDTFFWQVKDYALTTCIIVVCGERFTFLQLVLPNLVAASLGSPL